MFQRVNVMLKVQSHPLDTTQPYPSPVMKKAAVHVFLMSWATSVTAVYLNTGTWAQVEAVNSVSVTLLARIITHVMPGLVSVHVSLA